MGNFFIQKKIKPRHYFFSISLLCCFFLFIAGIFTKAHVEILKLTGYANVILDGFIVIFVLQITPRIHKRYTKIFKWVVLFSLSIFINDILYNSFYIEKLLPNFSPVPFFLNFSFFLLWIVAIIVFLSKILIQEILNVKLFLKVSLALIVFNVILLYLFFSSIDYVFSILSWQTLSQIFAFLSHFVIFDLAILCLIYADKKAVTIFLSGLIILVAGDMLVAYSMVSETSHLLLFGQLFWMLGLFVTACGLILLKKAQNYDIGKWFKKQTEIKNQLAFWSFGTSIGSFLIFFLIGNLFSIFNKSTFLFLPLFTMIYSVIIVVLAVFLGKAFESPFRKLYQNIETLKLGNGQEKLKTDFSTEEFISLQNFIIEAFKYKEEKDRAKKQLGEITAQVAHDIRSPTAAILMLANNASELPEDRRIILREAANRIQDIANNLLLQYRTQDHNTHLISEKASDVLVSAAIASVVSEKKVQPDHEHIQFISQIQAAAHFAFIKVDSGRLTRTLSNLINNASEAMNHRGTITLILEVEESQVKIIVRDQGNGMPAHLIEKIKNAQQITSGKKEGHGLGLLYALETLQQAQGNLDIQSTEGIGTEVILQFPRLKNPAWMAEAMTLKTHDTIVILDDDLSIHGAWDQRLQDTLAQNNTLRVKHFQQGLEAIQFINQYNSKDHIFLLTDYELLRQTVNGLDVIEQTGVNRSVVVTSHYANPQLIERALLLKTRVLPKLLASEVEIKLQDAMEQSKQSQIVDLVLIDDESFNHTFWQFAAKKNKKSLKCFESLAAFEREQTSIPFETPCYIDLNLKDESGLDVAKKLHERGFTTLYIATGLADFVITDYRFLSGVRDKQPPF